MTSGNNRPRARYPESFELALQGETNLEGFWDAVDTVKQDVIAGVKKFTRLAESGSVLSAYMLGDIYFWGYNGLRQGDLGLECLKQACNRGSIEGAYQLGRAYKALKDFDSYIATFSNLSDRNFSPAMFDLGAFYYYSGNNLRLSEKLFRLGSEAGNYHARKSLIVLMIKGKLGVSQIAAGLNLWTKIPSSFHRLLMTYPESDAFRGSPLKIRGSGFDPVLRASLLLIG